MIFPLIPIFLLKDHFAFCLSITMTFLPFFTIELNLKPKSLFWFGLYMIALFGQYSYPLFRS